MKPIVHGLESKYAQQIDFVYIDREAPENQAIVKQYGIRSQPIFILFDANGEIAKRFNGPISEDVLENALTSLLQ